MRPQNILVLIATLCCNVAIAAPPSFGPVDVRVINSPSEPVPVMLPVAPETVVCTRDAGSASGSDNPFRGIGFAGPLTGVQCPPGVSKIDVQRIGFTPDVGSSSAFNVAAFRVTVGVQSPGSSLPGEPGGLLAVVTDGAPVVDVLQVFQLDTTDVTRSLYAHVTVSSGIATVSATLAGTIFFVGTPAD